MPSMTDRQSVAIAGTVANVFQAAIHYRLKVPSRIRVYATAQLISMFLTVIIGDELFLDNMEVSAQNRMPLIPDDYVVECAGMPEDEIIVRWRNANAAANIAFVRADIEPL